MSHILPSSSPPCFHIFPYVSLSCVTVCNSYTEVLTLSELQWLQGLQGLPHRLTALAQSARSSCQIHKQGLQLV